MFQGILCSLVIFLFSTQASALSCQLLFKPFQLVQSVSSKENQVEIESREISGEAIKLLVQQKVVENDLGLLKLRRLTAENPFLLEALENIAYSHKYLEGIVQKNMRNQMRAVEMAYASGTSQVFMEKAASKKNNNSKVISLSEVRQKRAEEERAEYEVFVSQNFSEINYGFFQQLYQFLSVIHLKLNNSPTVKLTKEEYQSLKEVADNFNIYSNYLLAKEIVTSFDGPSKDFKIKLTGAISRSPQLKDKFIEYLSFMDKALQDQRFEDVVSSDVVRRAQNQLISEVQSIHLEGSEKRFESVIHYLEGRLID